ncbi:MAG: MBL fold metallo-hydrolase [bacterium]|nr:MBL fold metallo-hydrolase [bacterium]
MHATLVGHACWVIETTAGYILTDPVFFDPFEEGTVVSCPRRVVQPDRLPELCAIFLSHRHLDHYDFSSLAVLDRRVPVFCPEDPLLVYGLRHLGFKALHFLDPFVPQQLDGLRLIPIPSLNRDVLEYGLVLQDASATLFNQVDTFLSPAAIQRLHDDVGGIDVHFAMYASQNFGFFESKRDNTTAVYAMNLNTALMLDAGCVVPASAGFRFSDDLAWLNRHVFPIDAEQFMADLCRLKPMLRTETMHPGDTLTIEPSRLEIRRQVTDFVTMVEQDTYRLTYDPSAPVPPLQDINPTGYGAQGMWELAQGVLEVGLPQYIEGAITVVDDVAWHYARHGVTYQVEVVFPAASHCWTYHFDQQQSTYRLTHEAGEATPQIRLRITASALVDFCLGRRSYFYIRTQSRRASCVLEPVPTARAIEVHNLDLPDLLTHYVIHKMAGAERRGADWIDFVTNARHDC